MHTNQVTKPANYCPYNLDKARVALLYFAVLEHFIHHDIYYSYVCEM